jgi:lysozyme
MAYKLSNSGEAHLKSIEALRLRTYDDAQPNLKIISQSQVKGVLTIGYGHTGAHAKIGNVITAEKAMTILKEDLVRFEAVVNNNVTVPITQNMFNAMVSFAFNIGDGGFKKSKVLQNTNKKNYQEASKGFFGWLKPASLLSRRQKESDLYLNGFGVLKMDYTKKKVNGNLFFDIVKLGLIFSL